MGRAWQCWDADADRLLFAAWLILGPDATVPIDVLDEDEDDEEDEPTVKIRPLVPVPILDDDQPVPLFDDDAGRWR